MNADQINLLRSSFAIVESQSAVAGLIFYRHLFTLDPSLRTMFQSSIELQSRKLMEALSYTIATLENPEALVPVLEGLGRRHVAYGTRNEHYDAVITALLQTLDEALGDRFSSPVREAWLAALQFVCDTMKRSAATVSDLKQSACEPG